MHKIELRLTLKHFLPSEHALISGLISTMSEANRPHWVVSEDSNADAVILNAKAADAALSYTISSELAWGRPVGQVSAPGAMFADAGTPVPPQNWIDTTRQLLYRLEEELNDTLVWNSLAHAVQLHQNTGNPNLHLWNLELDSTLVAVVDFESGHLGLHPTAVEFTPVFSELMWIRKPSSARMPEEFVTRPLAQVMWQFAKRSTTQPLPTDLWQQKISLRQLPALRVMDLSDTELAIINYLVLRKVCTLPEIAQALGLERTVLARCVAGLLQVGAISPEVSPTGLLHRLQQFVGHATVTVSESHGRLSPRLLAIGLMPLSVEPSLV